MSVERTKFEQERSETIAELDRVQLDLVKATLPGHQYLLDLAREGDAKAAVVAAMFDAAWDSYVCAGMLAATFENQWKDAK